MNYNYDNDTSSGSENRPPRGGYYEPWQDPETTPAENTKNYYSPNYHDTARFAAIKTEISKDDLPPKTKEKKNNGLFGRFMRAFCLVLVCAFVSALAASYVVDRKLESVDFTPSNTVVIGNDAVETPKADDEPAPEVTGDVMSASDIYELACEQVVGIQLSQTGYNVFGQLTTSTPVVGTGFIISVDGYIVTNYHVIESYVLYGGSGGYELLTVMFGGETHTAEIVGFDEANDIAVLKIAASDLNPVTIGDMSSVDVGSVVYAVGNPLGELTYTMTDGIISALDRVISTAVSSSINVFQFNAAVNAGNSGGPVYNAMGEIIGIVDAKYQAAGVEGLSFAIPIDDAMNIITDLIEHGYVTGRAYMGINCRTVSSTVAAFYGLAEGAFIESIDPDGAAAKAGLSAGDIIIAINEDRITSQEELRASKYAYSAGDTVSVRVFRNGEELEFTMIFGEEPPGTSANNYYGNPHGSFN